MVLTNASIVFLTILSLKYIINSPFLFFQDKNEISIFFHQNYYFTTFFYLWNYATFRTNIIFSLSKITFKSKTIQIYINIYINSFIFKYIKRKTTILYS